MANALQTPIDALRFAIEFAQMDLSDKTPKAIAVITAGVQSFSFQTQPLGTFRLKPPPRADLATLQIEVRSLLTSIVEQGHTQVDLAVRALLGRSGKRRHVHVLWDGLLRDRFLLRLIRLLEELGADRLHVCPDPACGRLFFKVTRKRFCSTRCQSRVYMRKYRKGDI